uniref:Uncharacterized protein n=1 Tax=Daphnia galeata TaxID=27404 RepID=A0A8J2WH16_9CRUS|nr:unnamed protein product [Daphnia galeata]
MRLVPNSDPRLNIAVIMLEGRFDLRASGYHPWVPMSLHTMPPETASHQHFKMKIKNYY